jgi:apolipoprotein D and lipocalin family protein
MKKILALLLVLIGCVKIPKGVEPVTGFNLDKYLGKWYEIARLDHPFERGLERVSAEYSLLDGGGVAVLNKGFNKEKGTWSEAKGKAYFVDGRSDRGFLKVSFFGPFYGSYIVVELDKDDYQYSLVCGPDREYLWILARTPVIEDDVKEKLIGKAKELGFETDKLIWVEQ